MIVVRVELWPHGDGRRKETLGELVVWNDGTGTRKRGNYEGSALRKGTHREQRHGVVRDHPRLSQHVWTLVKKMLDAMGY